MSSRTDSHGGSIRATSSSSTPTCGQSGKPEASAALDRPVFHRPAADEIPTAGPIGKRRRARHPGRRSRFRVSDDFRLPLDADILAVYPHAHYLGKLLEAWATLPDGSKKWLIRIPDWDPNWQAVYHYREPVFLPKDSVIHMRYHYDNSAANARNPNHPPRRVRGGNQATDEMGHLWLQILPRGAGDHRLELQEAVMRHRLEKIPAISWRT